MADLGRFGVVRTKLVIIQTLDNHDSDCYRESVKSVYDDYNSILG